MMGPKGQQAIDKMLGEYEKEWNGVAPVASESAFERAKGRAETKVRASFQSLISSLGARLSPFSPCLAKFKPSDS